MQTAPSRRPCSRLGPAEAAVSGLPLPQSGALWPLRKARFRPGPVPLRRGSEAASDDASRLDRRAVAAGLLSALRALSSETPVVVAIDDAQWLDRSSAAALDYATRRMGELPVALLIARRLDCDPGLDLSLPPSRLLRVPVGPLDFVALNALLHARLGTVLRRPLLHRIHELSGGNPFFALELARDPARVDPGHGLPPTLDVLVRDRVSALPEAAQTALLVAAAASHPTAELVDRVTGTRDALAAAEEAGDDGLTRARALEGAATQLFRRRTQLDAAVDHAKKAAALADELGAEALLGAALSAQVLAEATLGRPEARTTLEAALAHQEAAAAERILAQPRWTAAIARMWWDEPAAVRETYEELAEQGRELGDER